MQAHTAIGRSDGNGAFAMTASASATKGIIGDIYDEGLVASSRLLQCGEHYLSFPADEH